MICKNCGESMGVADVVYYADHVIRKRKCPVCEISSYTREEFSPISETEFRRSKRLADNERRNRKRASRR